MKIVLHGTDEIRIVVARQLSQEPHNALLHLFGASAESVGYGAGHYQQRSHDTNSLLGRLLGNYQGEGVVMSYTMADYRRDTAKEYFENLTPEERREFLQTLPPEERREILQSLPPEEQQDVLQKLTPEQRLAGLSAGEIAKYLKRLQSERPSRKGKPRRKN